MRLTDYAIGKARRRLSSRSRLELLPLVNDEDDAVLACCDQRAKAALQLVQRFRIRPLQIASPRFNLNAYSEHQYLFELSFRASEINKGSSVLLRNGVAIDRSRYHCGSITAT